MTDDTWPPEVAEFYYGLSPDEGVLQSIVQLHDARLRIRHWKRIAGALAVACALILVASTSLLSNLIRDSTRPNNNDVVGSRPLFTDQNHIANPTPTDNASHADYDLIVVRIHKDWCGKCKQMGNVFAEIQRDFEDGRILFVTYDLTDEVTTKQSLLLGQILEIEPRLEEIESGNIAVLTTAGKFVELIDGTSGRRNLVRHIARQL